MTEWYVEWLLFILYYFSKYVCIYPFLKLSRKVKRQIAHLISWSLEKSRFTWLRKYKMWRDIYMIWYRPRDLISPGQYLWTHLKNPSIPEKTFVSQSNESFTEPSQAFRSQWIRKALYCEAWHRGMVEKRVSHQSTRWLYIYEVMCKKPKPRRVINQTEKKLLINNLRAESKLCGQTVL